MVAARKFLVTAVVCVFIFRLRTGLYIPKLQDKLEIETELQIF